MTNKFRRRAVKHIFITLLCLTLLCSCAEKKERQETFFAMDTVIDVTIYGGSEQLLNSLSARVYELESLFSVTDPESEIHALNETGSAALSPETSELLSYAIDTCGKTGGNLDISMYPIVRAWGFTTGEYRVPEDSEIKELLQNVDFRKITLDGNTATLPQGMHIDLGSVAKGFTGDILIKLLQENDVKSAIVNLGGNVQTLGSKPDGSPWRVAIKDPNGSYLGIVSVSDKAVITSGGYERYFEQDGHIYWHIMSPETGRPAESGLVSVTIVGSEGKYCDALSTALFVMGEEAAIDFWQDNQDFDMLLVTEDGRLLITPELNKIFQPSQSSSYELTVIE